MGCKSHSIENFLIKDKQVLSRKECLDPLYEDTLFLDGKAHIALKKDWKNLVVTEPNYYRRLPCDDAWWTPEAEEMERKSEAGFHERQNLLLMNEKFALEEYLHEHFP